MQNNKETTALVWFKNDLRTHDNYSLSKAASENNRVIAVYFLDPRYFKKDGFGFIKTGKFRTQFLLETLSNLKDSLKKLNIPLLIFIEQPEDRILKLIKDFGIDRLYYQKEWTQEELISIKAVKNSIPITVKIHEIYDQFLYHPEDIAIEIKNIPQVFTAFRKKLEKYTSIRNINNVKKLPQNK